MSSDLDNLEQDLHDAEMARYAAPPPIDPEAARRVVALCRYECPDHGCDLIEVEDVDEHGHHVFYRCERGEHYFGSGYDPVGGYFPVDSE